MTVEPFDRSRRATREDPTPSRPAVARDWLTTIGAALAAVHRAADTQGIPAATSETLRAGCGDTLAMFADAMPYSAADCALMCLSVKQRLDAAGPEDTEAQARIATDLLRIALFLGDQSGEGQMIDQLARAAATEEELNVARGHTAGFGPDNGT